MPDDETVDIDTTTDEITESTVDTEEEETDAEKVKLMEENKKLYARAKKAEGFVLENGTWVKKPKATEKPTEQNGDISQRDLLAIVRANVHDDDIDRVTKFAKLENISVTDALKHADLKAILASRAEMRKSAEATATSSPRRSVAKMSDEELVSKAAKGEIPKAGSKEAEDLFWARRGGRK